MRILCSIQDAERQGWALAFEEKGHAFSFFDKKVSPHNACQLFKPDIFLHNDDMPPRNIQNACSKYKVVMINVNRYDIPICANTFAYQVQGGHDRENFIAVFGRPNPEGLSVVSQFMLHDTIRIFSDVRWPYNEYCGFLNPTQFATICSKAKACLVAEPKPSILHYNACLCGANLLTMEEMDVGTPILNDKHLITNINKYIGSKTAFLKQMMDFTYVKQGRDCRIIPQIIESIYEQEKTGIRT